MTWRPPKPKDHDASTCPVCKDRDTLTRRQIAEAVGITVKSVGRHLLQHTPRPPGDLGPDGKEIYWRARDEGKTPLEALQVSGLSYSYARRVEALRRAQSTCNDAPRVNNRDEKMVRKLIALGGYPTLSERPTRTGPVACLPLIPFREIA